MDAEFCLHRVLDLGRGRACAKLFTAVWRGACIEYDDVTSVLTTFDLERKSNDVLVRCVVC